MSSAAIRYIDSPRPDTGLYNGKVGIWMFLASEAMLFGALFSTYALLRVGAPAGTWPVGASVLSVPMATINTIILITSTVTMLLSWAACKTRERAKFKLYQGLTVVLGAIFLAIKLYEYSLKFHHHLYPSTSTFLGLYFTMTGLHGLHVFGGIIVNAYFWGPGSKMWDTAPDQFTNRIESAGLYWHFVDLVWIFLFPVMYLL